MRSLIWFFFLLPFAAMSQINRSAKELASEQVQQYVAKKLFKDQGYHSLEFGELKAMEDRGTGIVWAIDHRFEISPMLSSTGSRTRMPGRIYRFVFYLDEKMRVLRSETFYSN